MFPEQEPLLRPVRSDETDIPVISPSMLEPEVDFERGMSPLPVVTIAIMLVCTAVFVCELAAGAHKDIDKLVAMGALARRAVGNGEVWRLVSAVFMHGSFEHIIGNVIMLYILGMGCEHGFGRAQLLVLFVGSGIAGSLCSLAQDRPSVGASGAIFGLAGGLVVLFYRYRHQLHLRDRRIGWVVAIWAGMQIVLGITNPVVDNFAHVGGLLGGSLLTLALQPAVLRDRYQVAHHPVTFVGASAAIVALLGTAVFFVPRLIG